MRFLLMLAALVLPGTAFAADQVALQSSIFVERAVTGPDGKTNVVREDPKLVTPGEKLLFQLNYRNAGNAPAEAFTVTNPIPDSVSFVSAEGEGATYSVDGGKSWGALATLKVTAADGSTRAAAPADVTHIRWTFARPIPVGGSGTLSFRGVVK